MTARNHSQFRVAYSLLAPARLVLRTRNFLSVGAWRRRKKGTFIVCHDSEYKGRSQRRLWFVSPIQSWRSNFRIKGFCSLVTTSSWCISSGAHYSSVSHSRGCHLYPWNFSVRQHTFCLRWHERQRNSVSKTAGNRWWQLYAVYYRSTPIKRNP